MPDEPPLLPIERLYYDPVSRQSWWPSRDSNVPHWAIHTPEGKRILFWQRMAEYCMVDNPSPKFFDISYVDAPYAPRAPQ